MSPVAPPSANPSGPVGPGGTGVAPSLSQKVTFDVVVPAAATAQAIARAFAAHRMAAAPGPTASPGTTPYVSPGIASISIQLLAVNGVSLAYPPPPATSQDIACPTPAAGCTVPVNNVVAAVGANQYLVTTYAQKGGPATPQNPAISSGFVVVVVGASGGGTGVVGDPSKIAIGGFVAKIVLSATNEKPNPLLLGQPGSGQVIVNAIDASGATIVGNAQFPFPVIITATGVTLSGPGLNTDGSYSLAQAEPAANLIGFAYDGVAQVASINARTTTAGGGSLSATPLQIVLATPTPNPSTSPTSPPPAAPSLYVLNAGNDTVVEYGLGSSGIPSSTTYRRTIGGPSIGCPSSLKPASDPLGSLAIGFGVAGITYDSRANNVVFGTSGNTCASPLEQLYVAGPSSTGASGVVTNLAPDNHSAAQSDIDLSYEPTSGYLDFTRNTGAQNMSNSFLLYFQVTASSANGSTAVIQNAVGADASTTFSCARSPGMPAGGNGCPNQQAFFFGTGFTAFLGHPTDPINTIPVAAPVASGANGVQYMALGDATDGAASATSSLVGSPGASIAVLKQSANLFGPSAMTDGVANATWIEGPDTLLDPDFGIAALSFDPTTNRLFALVYPDYYLQSGGFSINSPPIRPDYCTDSTGMPAANGPPSHCSDGDLHYFIVGYDVTQLPAAIPNPPAQPTTAPTPNPPLPPGAVDLKPVLVIGGDALHLPSQGNSSNPQFYSTNILPQNSLVASGGKVYLANPLGASCNASCAANIVNNGISPSTGEIEVYDGSASGYYNDANPGGVLLGSVQLPNVSIPVGLAVGTAGTVTMSPALRISGPLPHNLPIRARPFRMQRPARVH